MNPLLTQFVVMTSSIVIGLSIFSMILWISNAITNWNQHRKYFKVQDLSKK